MDIVITVLILGFLALVLFRLLGLDTSSRYDKNHAITVSRMGSLADCLNEYLTKNGRLPDTIAALLSSSSKSSMTNLDSYIDAWEHRFIFEPNDTNFVLISIGPDGIRGTRDDILKTSKRDD